MTATIQPRLQTRLQHPVVAAASRPAPQRHRRHRDVDDVRPRSRRGSAVVSSPRPLVGVALAAVIACGIVLTHDVLTDPSGVPASAASGRSAPQRVSVIARPGDTLWSIAESYRGDISVSRYVDLLVRVNGGASIRAGQPVLLP